MKVGILSFEEALVNRTLRGVSTTTRYLQQNLRNEGLDVDLLVYGRSKLNYPDGFDIARHCKNLEELSKLKEDYDFIIYYTPGRSLEKFDESDRGRYLDVLEAVGLPFTYIYHSEEYIKHQPYQRNFTTHPDCKFLTLITEELKEVYQRDLELVPEYVVVGMFPPLNSLEYILNQEKSNSVILTSAWTNFKRNMEYFALTGKFSELGIDPYSAGGPNSNFYMNDILDYLVESVDLIYDEVKEADDRSVAKYKDYLGMMARLKQEAPIKKGEEYESPRVIGAWIHTKDGDKWYDYGSYFPEEMHDILKDKKFHWNMSCYKTSKMYIPRFEVVTLEALNEGCLPVICKETTPEWVPDDSAVRLSKIDYADHIDILSNMTEEERIERLTKFYELIKERLYNTAYGALKDKILQSVHNNS